MKKYLVVWLLIIGAYLMEFGIPLVAGYYLFTRTGAYLDNVQIYGGVFVAIIVAVGVSFYARLKAIMKAIEVGYGKLSIKLFGTMWVFFLLYQIVLNVQSNTESIVKWIFIAIIGQFISYVFKMLAVKKDKEYINKIGVFN